MVYSEGVVVYTEGVWWYTVVVYSEGVGIVECALKSTSCDCHTVW